MKMRLRAGLVILLSLAALRAGIAAYKSIRPYALSVLPEDIYLKYSTRLDNAAYCLKSCGGYVAVYDTEHPRTPQEPAVSFLLIYAGFQYYFSFFLRSRNFVKLTLQLHYNTYVWNVKYILH